MSIEKNWLFSAYLIIVAILGVSLESYIARLKKLAASIQERFDRYVLRIENNPILDVAFIDSSFIRRHSKKARAQSAAVSSVENWYSENISQVDANLATILCQRSSVVYDFSLRAYLRATMLALVLSVFFGLLLIAVCNDISMQSFITEVLVPSIPIIALAYRQIGSNIATLDNLRCLKYLISNAIDKANAGEVIHPRLLRQIQDRIFMHRVSAPLIPDFVYRHFKPQLEDEMNYSALADVDRGD